MSKITIREVDNTRPGTSPISTDIVYIPGICYCPTDMYVFTDASVIPDNSKHEKTIASNIANTKTWKYIVSEQGQGSWVEQASYIDPGIMFKHIFGDPVQCNTLAEFDEEFGDKPFVFDVNTTVGSNYYTFKAGTADSGFIMARELLRNGVTVVFENMIMIDTTAATKSIYRPDWISAIYNGRTAAPVTDPLLERAFDNLADKGEYSIKYITTGGFPIFGYDENRIVKKLLSILPSPGETEDPTMDTRGDTVALIDYNGDPSLKLIGSQDTDNLYDSVKEFADGVTNKVSLSYATMFAPYFYCNVTDSYKLDADSNETTDTFILPGSYCYLRCLAESLKSNPNYYAIAGVARGVIPGAVKPNYDYRVTGKIADLCQPRNAVAINAITNIKNFGYTIWGNRTLKDNSIAAALAGGTDGLTATSFLNVRNMCSDIKKRVYDAAMSLMFENNTTILWVNFKNKITPLLEELMGNYAVEGYQIIQENTDMKAKLKARILIKPTYPVEEFDVTIELTDSDVTVG